MIDRRLIENFDWILLGLTLLLCSIGLVILYSVVNAGEVNINTKLFSKQIIWFASGLLLMFITLMVNYKCFERWGPGFYAICIMLLICVIFFGKYVGGSRRWLVLGPITIQPSEIVKIAVIIILAKFYSRKVTKKGFSLKMLFIPFMLIIVPFLLIVKQPDLGTAMMIILISSFMTLFIKIERKTFFLLITLFSISIPMVWYILKDYQKVRILTFLNPDRDPYGAGYHILQSKIAIGSGMITGKGFLKGTQHSLSFLPEQHTDFILSILAEEWGFIGSTILIFIYLIFLLWGLNIAHKCRDPFGTILAVGIVAMIFWQISINIGMVMGLMPVVGVPLPLISYGGSSVITTMIGVGILMSISIRQFVVD